ncbi:MAG: C-type lectin domain-containing protein, partial [Polyangiaceae bacterium]|nr:C-type lectin domain-containing protein [Polyangiaceae bacterium]
SGGTDGGSGGTDGGSGGTDGGSGGTDGGSGGTDGGSGGATGGAAGTGGTGGAVDCTEDGAELWSANGHCYFLLPGGGQKWETQRDQCEAAGAHLVVITSAEEQDLVASISSESRRWIGLSKTRGSGFAWTTGEPFSYTSWKRDEPNIRDDACVRMIADSGLWEDRDCDERNAAICERE